MTFRLRLTNDDNSTLLEFDCTVGYLDYLWSQLQGREQPIHPCLVFKIQSFGTLGPRLGVYLSGTSYSKIGVGNLGDCPEEHSYHSINQDIGNIRIHLNIMVDDKQLIELYSISRSITKNEKHPYTWTTTVPKGAIQTFGQKINTLNRDLTRTILKHVSSVIDCPHCEGSHPSKEVDMPCCGSG